MSGVQLLIFSGQNSEISPALDIFYVGGLPILCQTFDIGILQPNGHVKSEIDKKVDFASVLGGFFCCL